MDNPNRPLRVTSTQASHSSMEKNKNCSRYPTTQLNIRILIVKVQIYFFIFLFFQKKKKRTLVIGFGSLLDIFARKLIRYIFKYIFEYFLFIENIISIFLVW